MKDSKASVPTLSDVAARAQVSKVTVSAVINGSRSNTRVSDATRQRILQIAAELQYRPNAIARSLRRQSTDIIGLYCGHGLVKAQNFFLSDVIGGLQTGCDQHQKDLLLHGSFHRRSAKEIHDALMDGKLDGLILIAFADDPLVDWLRTSSLPAVALADAVPGLPSVVVDDREGARLLARHLASRGHKRVLYRACDMPMTSTNRRYAAFQGAATALGIDIVATFPSPSKSDLSPAELEWLALPTDRRPSALVCWTDTSAHSVVMDCRRRGIRVPDDLAIVGFDGIEGPMEPAMRLTTIRAPWEQAAHTAVDVLVSRLKGEEVPLETVLPVELVVSDTA